MYCPCLLTLILCISGSGFGGIVKGIAFTAGMFGAAQLGRLAWTVTGGKLFQHTPLLRTGETVFNPVTRTTVYQLTRFGRVLDGTGAFAFEVRDFKNGATSLTISLVKVRNCLTLNMPLCFLP